MLKTFKHFFLLILFSIIFTLILPKDAFATLVFEENFNGIFSVPHLWTLRENEGSITFTPTSIQFQSDNKSFPFLHTNSNVFPEDNFKISIAFQYLRSGPAYGDGISISNNLPTNGEISLPIHTIFGIWQDPTYKFRLSTTLCPETNPDCTTSTSFYQSTTDDLGYHIAEISFIDGKYFYYFDGTLIFTSSIPTTTVLPTSFWLGNPFHADNPGGWSSFKVDFIKIETLKEGLPISHLSQRDVEWKDFEYDFSSLRNPPGWREIGVWGCAMTSATMVLNYHGYSHGPDGQETNPFNLNQYLKDNGWFADEGNVIWDGFSKYAEFAKANDQVPDTLPNLEFKYSDFDPNLLEEDIEAATPGIIEIVMNDYGTLTWEDDALHFVVAKGVKEDGSVIIDDPWNIEEEEETILQEKYPSKVYRRIARFVKNNSDTSYLWLVLYGESNVLVEHQGKRTGVDKNGTKYSEIPNASYFEQGIPANPINPSIRYGDGKGSKVFLLPKPTGEEYKLIFSGDKGEHLDFDLHTFARNGGSDRFDIEEDFLCQDEINYLLNYSFEEEDEPELEKLPDSVSYSSLICKINLLYNQGEIKNRWFKNLLVRLTKTSQKFNNRGRVFAAKMTLLSEKKLIEAYTPFLIKPDAAKILTLEINRLITQL